MNGYMYFYHSDDPLQTPGDLSMMEPQRVNTRALILTKNQYVSGCREKERAIGKDEREVLAKLPGTLSADNDEWVKANSVEDEPEVDYNAFWLALDEIERKINDSHRR
jgi:hypothetical protein